MTRPLPYLFAALAAILGYCAVDLAHDRPILPETSLGDHRCSAPWQTALTGDDNRPADAAVDRDDIASRCVVAGQARFVQASGFGGASLLSLGIGGVVIARRRTGLERQE